MELKAIRDKVIARKDERRKSLELSKLSISEIKKLNVITNLLLILTL